MKSLDFQSISVEAFGFGGDQFVVFAQPFIGRCSFMEWDHVQMEFRNFDNITSKQTAVEMLCMSKGSLYRNVHFSVPRPYRNITIEIHIRVTIFLYFKMKQ